MEKRRLSTLEIWSMSFGFLGIQMGFALQNANASRILQIFGADVHELSWFWIIAPLMGLIVQPIIGYYSDKTWGRFGRRKPFFLIGALISSVALIAMPFSSSIFMAASLLWILDAANNIAMEPYRAFVADTLDEEQQPTGFQAQSFFTGFGQFLSYISLFLFPIVFVGYTGALPNWIYASFFLGSVLSITSIWWSMKKTPEIPPTAEELVRLKAEPLNIFSPFIDIYKAVLEMPKVMWQLALVYLFQWYALFCYWQNSSKSIALSVWNATLRMVTADQPQAWRGSVPCWEQP